MKRCFSIYLVFLIILILACTRTKANVIFLYQKIHFYEVVTNLNIQPFATFIGGDGICAAELTENHISVPLISGENEAQTKLDKEYQFMANTLIYSNYEKTLSFLLEVEFNSINIPGLQKIKGYELKFYFDEQTYSCVQIMSDHNDPVNNFKRYKFRIKDPSFLSHTNNWYTFYFGKIVVRALTTCDDKSSIGYKQDHLCAVGSSQSSPLEIGIKSEKMYDTFKIVPDLCKGHLMQQTCILRYSPFSVEKDDYYIILQAMSDEFETILGDSDIFSLEIDQLKQVEEARNWGKKSIYFENIEYYTDLDPNSLYFAPNLVSKRTQMFDNGIVAKFIKSGDRMNYVGILNEPSEKNVCFNESADSHKYCKCDNECTECYKIPKQENKNQVINYVPLNHDGFVKIKKSKHCSDYPFNLFNFDNIKMAFNFQNQDLSSVRKNNSLDESSYMLSNRDFLPRLCIDFKYGEAKGFFKLSILFNDFRHLAESNVLDSIHYKFNLYEYSYVDKEIHKKAYGKKFLFRLDVRPIAFIDPISSKELVEIKHLKKGKYFLELLVNQRSKFCPGVDQCIDESAVNNEIRCVKCNRLLIKFDLQSKMVSDSDSIEPKNKYTREHCHRIKPEIKIEKLDTKINFNNFKCPRESTVLTNIINNSNFDLNEIFFKTETLAGLLPNNFNLSLMMLPFDYSDQMDLIEFCDGIDFVDVIGNRYSVFIIISFLIIIFIFIMIYLISFQSILNYAFISNKKIVFYLSIFLSKEQQEELNEFVLKYTNLLTNFSIQIIDYSIDNKTRSEAVENADKIVYVCGTKDEIKNLRIPLIIAQNKFHDEYNKLHCFPQYKAKTIYVTFNQQVQPLNLEEVNTEKSSLMNSNSSTESKQTGTESNPKFSNFSNSMSIAKSASYQEALSHKYLKLPEQNKLLISCLLGPDKNCLFSHSASKNENFSCIQKMARDVYIKRFDKKTRCLIKNDRSNVLHFERNNLFDDDMAAGCLEISDLEFESLIQMCSITSSQSISDDSSKTTYDANELSNEVEQMEQKPLIHRKKFY